MIAYKAKKTVFGLLLIVFLFISAVSYGAEYSNPQLLVTPADIEKNKGKWIVIDCRDDKAYAAGHIPGAINLGGACGKVLRDTTLRIKKTGDIEKLLGEAGVSMDKPVAVYADAKLITSATVAFWALEYLGHTDVRFLNGGIEEWQSVGKPLDNTKTKLPPVTFKANVVKNRIATTDEMVRIAKGEIKDVNVIDSRSEKENKGEDIRSVRGGHIPNTTINVSHTDTYHVETGTLYSADGLEMLFGKLDMNKRTIPYCQTGTRSTLTYLELRLMGFKEPANYDDSWIIYGSNVDCPVANENWYDFVKVNDALKKIDALTKEIEELKKR
ncbi:MAG: rhodanese-like domain-containing protein [Thermodesulfovibrionales bacterium]|nr:rhodanese-like domain-containing protein [Thermodesulfovibrionales bacterium]